ncbi:double-strand break repair protein AddB [Inquilinus limosus]|uniref:Double-strand break repair protein AddB n=1 Tax=Inquilinus limosus TaxID=171674 RepID=A0A211ZMD3_9PROT|nr:double-strand break repair protein AddB [Inquilinus limosus]OWJ66336.1 double-strand break repair protein AddB [Inquilinus limosus]
MTPRIYTIAAGGGVADALARGLLARAAGDPLALGAMTVLLPSRRAGTTLRDAFLRAAEGKPLLLPRLLPVGDIDADALGLAAGETPAVAEALALPPAIQPRQRQILLARLVLARPDPQVGADQAMHLAAALARLLDEVQAEGLGFDRLDGLVPEELAEHWQETLEFLRIVTTAWPEVLKDLDALDPAEWRARLTRAQAEAWQAAPPADPVIAAGLLGTNPAEIGLLRVVATLPQGALVLPGLDRFMDGESWDQLDDGHPQQPLKRMLEGLGVDRAQVADWPDPTAVGGPDRTVLLREVMRPAATTDAWRHPAGLDAAALSGLTRIDCATAQEEAGVIALLLREVLETPGRTAALVTPDRDLARRVAADLTRWQVAVDDSAGRPLADTPVGAYLRLVGDVAFRDASPLSVLALLKHPLAAGGEPIGLFREALRRLEREVLRGPAPEPGIAGLQAALAAGGGPALAVWLDKVGGILSPFIEAVRDDSQSPAELLRLHITCAEALAATDAEPGPARLWRAEDGEAAQALADELLAGFDGFPAIPGPDWPGLFEAMMDGAVVRPRWGRHPRLAILGPVEARMARFDRIVLGGLNEGTWPGVPAADPWLSRPMRRQFGLPAPERRIGLAANDFAQAAAGTEVFLTRAEKVEGTPTVPSRWLLRLQAVLDGAGLALTPPARDWRALARHIDEPEAVRPVAPPRPKPPVEARPRRLSVTQISVWMQDPYAIYARMVLGLEPLDPIEAEPGASERGTAIHAALAALVQAHPDALPPDALERLLVLGRAEFARLPPGPDIRTFWWPRFARIAAWFVETEGRLRAAGRRAILTEQKGLVTLPAPGGAFALSGVADRIDQGPDGLVVVDYKTGVVPSNETILAGHQPQLPLEAMMIRDGGFPGVPAGVPVAGLEHWRLSGAATPGEVKPVKPAEGDFAALADQALGGLMRLIARFDLPETPYLSQPRGLAPRFSDYAHLARVKEWSAGGGEG